MPKEMKITIVSQEGWSIRDDFLQNGKRHVKIVCSCGQTEMSCRKDYLSKLKPFCRLCARPQGSDDKVWCWVKGKESFYSVSEDGEVYSTVRKIILKPSYIGQLAVVSFGKNESKKYVHKLVAEAFLGTDYTSRIVHLDGDRKNNNFKNLKEYEKTYDNLIGENFGRLKILNILEDEGNFLAECGCFCGETKITNIKNLISDSVTSCGCKMREILSTRNTTHGQSRTSTYHIWQGMKYRCYVEGSKHYVNYGARGIRVCDRWLELNGKGFLNFLEDMGERPKDKTLDRIDNNGHYCKENCRWVDSSTQAFNQRKKSTNRSGRTGIYPTDNGKFDVIFCGKREGRYDTFETAVFERERLELAKYGITKE